MKKIIFIGKTGSGKTSICQRLSNDEIKYKKTQSVDVYADCIDTPGEYLENRFYHKALIVTAADAEIIAIVYDCTCEEAYIPPGFAGMFARVAIGIITKVDLVDDDSQIKHAEQILLNAGVSKVFKISCIEGDGMKELEDFIFNQGV